MGIRLVRFNSFLSLVPYKTSTGFGGSAVSDLDSTDGDEVYDKGLVQKMVLIVLKCVALTTREARVESSSGESDSSASSRESISSGGSDMIIIERTMSGMYKVLDVWIKDILPVLPDQSLQESLLHLLQEQDDVLIEGLLCLLDTHMALYVPGKKDPEPDWAGFIATCDCKYTEAVQILLDLKQSIARLLSKSLFPYNIGPVYRLLEKVENFHLNQKDS